MRHHETFKDRVDERRRARKRGEAEQEHDIYQGAFGPTLFGVPWYFWIIGLLALGLLIEFA